MDVSERSKSLLKFLPELRYSSDFPLLTVRRPDPFPGTVGEDSVPRTFPVCLTCTPDSGRSTGVRCRTEK